MEQTNKNNQQIIRDIRDRIQFLVTVEIFFSTIIYLFFKVIGSDEIISNSNALFWGVGVSFCILNYLLVGTIEEPKRNLLTLVRGSISLNFAFFILPIMLLVVVVKNPLPGYYLWPFQISLWGAIVMPFVTFLLILGIQYWQGFRWALERLSKKKATKKLG
jgi:hypothetical protein